MNHHDLHTLLDYHYWARDRVLDAAEKLTLEQFRQRKKCLAVWDGEGDDAVTA